MKQTAFIRVAAIILIKQSAGNRQGVVIHLQDGRGANNLSP
jgi:hypothetical protein